MGTSIGSRSGSTPGSFGMGGSRRIRRPCLTGWGPCMATRPGRRGQDWSWRPGIMGPWGTGFPWSGGHLQKSRGGWGPFRVSNGARGMGSWRDMGISRVEWSTVGSVSVRVAPLMCSFGCRHSLVSFGRCGDAWTLGYHRFFPFFLFFSFLLTLFGLQSVWVGRYVATRVLREGGLECRVG